jgi:hypothetical protein
MAVSAADVVFWSSAALFATGVVTFFGCSILAAPYGKYAVASGQWGPLVPAKIAWIVMESPNLWVPLLVYLFGSDTLILNPVNQVLLFCFLLHYTNRSIIYPLRMGKVSPMPLSVMLAAFAFCSWNGSNQALSLLLVHSNEHVRLTDMRVVVGLALFFAGLGVNIHSDSLLLAQRRTTSSSTAAPRSPSGASAGAGAGPKYVIPTGGMFEYVSCANYCKPPCDALCSHHYTHSSPIHLCTHTPIINCSW